MQLPSVYANGMYALGRCWVPWMPQAITWSNIRQYVWCHITSLGHNDCNWGTKPLDKTGLLLTQHKNGKHDTYCIRESVYSCAFVIELHMVDNIPIEILSLGPNSSSPVDNKNTKNTISLFLMVQLQSL